MRTLELAIWSMALGAIAAVVLARIVDLTVRPGLAQVRALGYHVTVLVLVLVLSGVLEWLAHPGAARLQMLQVLAGPCCVGLSNFWIRGWLGANHRDRLMAAALRTSGWLLPVAGFFTLALPRAQQLPVAAAISLLGGMLTLWLTVRAWRMGDHMAPTMAVGCALTLPAIAGLYWLALPHARPGLGVQVLLALFTALSNGCTGYVLWRRDIAAWRTLQQEAMAPLDPVTRLHSGTTLVQQLLAAQKRRRRTRRPGALLAVMVFDLERVTALAGTGGVQDLFVALAARMQRQVGVVNPVGRYWDRCFIALVETIDSPPWLRTLGLRLASSLRQPVVVRGHGGQRTPITADIGVGVVPLAPGSAEVEDILHDGQLLAEAARRMRSRAATFDPATGTIVPVEEADFGPRLVPRPQDAWQAASRSG